MSTRLANPHRIPFVLRTAIVLLLIPVLALAVLPATIVRADAPVLNIPGEEVTYDVGAGPVMIAPNLSLTGDPIAQANVTIGDGFSSSQDRLGVNGAQSGSSGSISWSYNTSTGVLSLSGTASTASYQSILRTVTYQNISGSPSSTPRKVDFHRQRPVL